MEKKERAGMIAEITEIMQEIRVHSLSLSFKSYRTVRYDDATGCTVTWSPCYDVLTHDSLEKVDDVTLSGILEELRYCYR